MSHRQRPMEDLKYANTTVFWNVEDFPIPHGGDLNSFIKTIKSALEKAGYHGRIFLKAYGAKDRFDGSIPFVTERDSLWRLRRMLADIDMWILVNCSYAKPTNVMVLAKNIPDGIDFVQLLDMLTQTVYHVLLAVPQEWIPEQVPLPKVNKAWYWESLIGGGDPISETRFAELLARCPDSGPQYFLC